jgi:SAM-dependent methyltransferase
MTTPPALAETTFRNYNTSQVSSYSSIRSAYVPALYDEIMKFHTTNGGSFGTVVDIGCGPGNATRDLATYFAHTYSINASREIISQAKQLGGITRDGESIRYCVCEAEKIGQEPVIADASVDMLTSAMAVHWFDFDKFWETAARIVKPGGTVALWTCAWLYCHPSTPNANRIQSIINQLRDDILQPYELLGNRLSDTMYRDLPLPWDLDPPIDGFLPGHFQRMEWNVDGQVEENSHFFMYTRELDMDGWEQQMGTASMVTRWREAHPELVGTSNDCVKATRIKLDEAVDDKIKQVTFGPATALLMFKRRV